MPSGTQSMGLLPQQVNEGWMGVEGALTFVCVSAWQLSADHQIRRRISREYACPVYVCGGGEGSVKYANSNLSNLHRPTSLL